MKKVESVENLKAKTSARPPPISMSFDPVTVLASVPKITKAKIAPAPKVAQEAKIVHKIPTAPAAQDVKTALPVPDDDENPDGKAEEIEQILQLEDEFGMATAISEEDQKELEKFEEEVANGPKLTDEDQELLNDLKDLEQRQAEKAEKEEEKTKDIGRIVIKHLRAANDSVGFLELKKRISLFIESMPDPDDENWELKYQLAQSYVTTLNSKLERLDEETLKLNWGKVTGMLSDDRITKILRSKSDSKPKHTLAFSSVEIGLPEYDNKTSAAFLPFFSGMEIVRCKLDGKDIKLSAMAVLIMLYGGFEMKHMTACLRSLGLIAERTTNFFTRLGTVVKRKT